MPDDPSPAPENAIFPAPAGDVRIFVTTAPPDVASDIAGTLVRERLAACVNLVPGLRSVYRWQGSVLDDPETLLIVKTRAQRLPLLEERLRALHPYEVPEGLVLAPEGGLEAYLAWIRESTTETGREQA